MDNVIQCDSAFTRHSAQIGLVRGKQVRYSQPSQCVLKESFVYFRSIQLVLEINCVYLQLKFLLDPELG